MNKLSQNRVETDCQACGAAGHCTWSINKKEGNVQQTHDLRIFDKGLRRIRRSKRVAIFLFLGFIPVGIISFILDDLLNISFLFIIVPYLMLVMASEFYIGLTATCLRCTQLYYWRTEIIGFRNFFTKRCLNCGLDLNTKRYSGT